MKEKVKNFLKKYYRVILLILPFLLMDGAVRISGIKINYFRMEMIVPGILFVAMWIWFLVGITISMKQLAARIFYGIIFCFFGFFFYAQCIYFELTGYYGSFSLLGMLGEAGQYFGPTILKANPLIHLTLLLAITLCVLAEVNMPKREKGDIKRFLIVTCVFLVLHIVNPFLLGKANDGLQWDSWRNPRNVYNNFNDSNKNMKICGLYEYTVRDFYVTYLRPEEPEDPVELEYLDDDYGETKHSANEFTGIFEGKNVIFLQLEGMDNWLLNEEDTPVLYSLMADSIIFNNHFSYYNGGGSTFNSELAVNTGFITPISYVKNAYTLNTNLFPYSLPNMFKERGYAVNAFHMNSEEYYSRGINYENWGYDEYYGLTDEQNYSDASYMLDRELVENEVFYDRLFNQEGNFVHYIITYTPHTPFTIDSEVGKYLIGLNFAEDEVVEMDEESCARMFAAETDYMVGLLLQGLKDKGLYDNTVLVIYADHYLYTLGDKTILDKYKNSENNLINQTPFFIWSSDMPEILDNVLASGTVEYEKFSEYKGNLNGVINRGEEQPDIATEGVAADNNGIPDNGEVVKNDKAANSAKHCGIVINKVNSQIDILPTVLNLFGFEYTNENYVGSDIFDADYSGYAFFSDYSWYNGIVYAEGMEKYTFVGEDTMDEQEINSMNEMINNVIKKNDLMLKYDYFRRKQQNTDDTAVE